jgi:hypothetical protein
MIRYEGRATQPSRLPRSVFVTGVGLLQIHAYFTPTPAASLDVSQKHLLAVGFGSHVHVSEAGPQSEAEKAASRADLRVRLRVLLGHPDLEVPAPPEAAEPLHVPPCAGRHGSGVPFLPV